jgi:hypothetical protein
MGKRGTEERLTMTVDFIEDKDTKGHATRLVKQWLIDNAGQKPNVSAKMSQDGSVNKPGDKPGRKFRRALILLKVVRGATPDAAKAEVNKLTTVPQFEYLWNQIVGEINTESNPHRADGARYDNLRVGINIGQEGHPGPGTLGLFVRCRRNNKVMILSNMHVMRANNGPTDSNNILHPSQAAGGGARDVIAVYDRGMVNESIDAAVAYLAEKYVAGAHNATPEGVTLAARMVTARKGLKVCKRGCSSRLTDGTVEDIAAQKTVAFKAELGGGKVMSNQIKIDGDNFQISGDSGSILFDDASKGIVGLMHGGGKADNDGVSKGGLACPIEEVLAALEVDLM